MEEPIRQVYSGLLASDDARNVFFLLSFAPFQRLRFLGEDLHDGSNMRREQNDVIEAAGW